MIYDFLRLSFDETVAKYPETDCLDRTRKALAYTEGNTLDSLSDNSDLLLYYDCVQPTVPLMVVERLSDEEVVSTEVLEHFAEALNRLYSDYVFYYNILEDKEYVDFSAVRRNVYDVLEHKES